MTIADKRIEEVLKPKAYKNFCKFMQGQTVELGDDGSSAMIFEDDFLCWMKHLPVID